MNQQPKQRDYTLDHALVLASDSLKKLEMDFSLQKIGTSGKLDTYLCLMNNHKTQLTFRGSGSGLAHEAKIKAIYEGMENSLLHQSLNYYDDQNIKMFSTQSSPSTLFMQQNELLPEILKKNDFLNKPYPWLKLKKLDSKDDIFYPLSLLFPYTHHIEHYNRYVNQFTISQIANSTGVAIGATENEALIHGINDWIERDAYGLFLLDTMIRRNKPARCIIKKTLPDNLQKYIKTIENIYDDELIIIDITTNLHIPSFFISFTKQRVPVQPSGLGASLCKIDAIQHALFESLQARDRYNENTIFVRHKKIQHYQKYPALLRAFQSDLVELRNAGCFIDINWNDLITHQVESTLSKQLDLIMAMIKPLGISIYYNILFQEYNGLTLVYVLLVGVETFGMMREGLFFPVKKRGLERLT